MKRIVFLLMLLLSFAFANAYPDQICYTLSGGNVCINNTGFSGIGVSWDDLVDMPGSCPPGYFVSSINNTVTCSYPSYTLDTKWDISNFYLINDLGILSLNETRLNQTINSNSYWVKNSDDIYYNGGNVGIGTTNPLSNVEIKGSGNSAELYLVPQNLNTENASSIYLMEQAADIWGGEDTYGFRLQYDGLNNLFKISSGAESTITDIMTIKRNGKVGIGTTEPNGLLDIWGSNSTKGGRVTINPSTGTSDNRNLVFYSDKIQSTITNSGSAATLSLNPDGGNVGIGTTNPDYTLEIVGNPGLSYDGIQVRSTSYNTNDELEIGFRMTTAEGKSWAGIKGVRTNSPNSGNTELKFFTYGSGGVSDKMTLTTNGQLQIEDLKGTYSGGSAYVCVYNNGTIYASESACP